LTNHHFISIILHVAFASNFLSAAFHCRNRFDCEKSFAEGNGRDAAGLALPL
jgi:hypothetical protein